VVTIASHLNGVLLLQKFHSRPQNSMQHFVFFRCKLFVT